MDLKQVFQNDQLFLSKPKIPAVRVHIIMLFDAVRNMQGNAHSKTIFRTGSGSASSLVRSMKNAREDPQASEKMDTMTLTIIDGGK